MDFTDKAEAGKSVTNVDVPAEDRQRFSITDAEVNRVTGSIAALTIENNPRPPNDIGMGADGLDGKLYILQARPETVKFKKTAPTLRRFSINGEKLSCAKAELSVKKLAKVKFAW